MTEETLMVRDDSRLTVSFAPAAIEEKEQALALSAMIGKVTNAEENAAAVGAQGALLAIKSKVEKCRKVHKEPILKFGRLIDRTAESFIAEVDDELARIGPPIGDFAALETAKANASALTHSEKLNALEKERMSARANAKSHEALDAIDEHFADKAAAVAPPLTAARVEGQVVRSDWDVQVVDIWLLARSHPGCVKIEPRISEIKELLKAGVKVAGVKAEPITKSGVRANSRALAIDV